MKRYIHAVHIFIGMICVSVAVFTSYAIGRFDGPILLQLSPWLLIVIWALGYTLCIRTEDMKWMALSLLVLVVIGCYLVYSVVS